jgi:hypothetical protein
LDPWRYPRLVSSAQLSELPKPAGIPGLIKTVAAGGSSASMRRPRRLSLSIDCGSKFLWLRDQDWFSFFVGSKQVLNTLIL